MISKRTRELILVKSGKPQGKALASWQQARLIEQAKKWPAGKLEIFYDKLFAIEVRAKTNTGFYSIPEALAILFCYYLQ